MEAIVGVWLTSIFGAGAFTAAGYIFGQRSTVAFLARALPEETPPAPQVTPAAPEATPLAPPPLLSATPPAPTVSQLPPPVAFAATPSVPPVVRTPTVPPATLFDEFDDGALDKPTVVPEKLEGDITTRLETISVPPLRALGDGQVEALRAEVKEALAKAATAAEKARAAEAARAEREREIAELKEKVTKEVILRASADARVEELSDRLAAASEESTRLRHRVAQLDRTVKQLREALQGRVRALTTSELQRRRDLEEAEEMRVKLRDVSEKLERTSSLPPIAPSTSMPPLSMPESALPPRFSSIPASGLGDIASLTAEISRLKTENRSLRARSLGGPMPKKASRDSLPIVDLDPYRTTLIDAAAVNGIRGAVLADEVGSVLVGTGDLAEGLAAFGAFIRDASARTEGLLPLEAIEEVSIRDRSGMLLWTRVVGRDLSLVLLGGAESALASAKRLLKDRLRLET